MRAARWWGLTALAVLPLAVALGAFADLELWQTVVVWLTVIGYHSVLVERDRPEATP